MRLLSDAKGTLTLSPVNGAKHALAQLSVNDAIRFLGHEASFCRSRDEHEAFCLLMPPLLKALGLRPMNGYEAEDFRRGFKQQLERASSATRV